MRAASANPMDWKIRDGLMEMVTGRTLPRGFGTDFAGVVEAVGEGVTRLRVGDAVLGGTSPQDAGSFADVLNRSQGAPEVAGHSGVIRKNEGL